MTTRTVTRRQFAGSVGAGLLLAPFWPKSKQALAQSTPEGAKSKRLLLFCTMGTYPPIWTPTGISGESITSWSTATAPLAAIKDSVILVEGMPSGNPGNNHGAPDAITGLGNGYYNGQLKVSVDQFVASKLVAAGINRPLASLLLGANTNANGANSVFYGGTANGGNNLPTIGSPLSAYTTVFGGALPDGTSASSLLKRRKSILDLIRAEATALKTTLGATEKAKLDLHLESVRQLENKLMQSANTTPPATCTKPTAPPGDGTLMYMSELDTLAANAIHQDIIVSAFACDITRVAALQYGNDGKLMVNLPGRVPYDDEHGGFIHSGAASNYKNLAEFEKYLAEQFVALVDKLKKQKDPEDSSKTLFDTTIIAWCRDMGDAQNHDQKSMRFVLASGSGGYLKTAAGGRYIKSGERHERILLNLCQAMGVTSYTGFGDPALTGAAKAPLTGLAA